MVLKLVRGKHHLLTPNLAVKGTACKLRLQVPSAFGSGRPLPLR
jgi:hypothetical protein